MEDDTSGPPDFYDSAESCRGANISPMVNLKQARMVAALLHVFTFVSTWILFWIQPQPLLDGPSRYPFFILFLADLPFSALFFGIFFTSADRGPYAVVAWGIVGTIWWWFLGNWIDKLRNRKT
jgi:hypothetical protein